MVNTDIAEHARFFDHLVELVPAKFYYDDDFAKVNPRFLAKAARAAAKADAKTKAKEARRERLDPDKAATTLEVQRRKKLASQQGADGDDGAGAPSTSGTKGAAAVAATAGPSSAGHGPNAPTAAGLQLQLNNGANRQELLDRLHRKLEEARSRRKAADDTAAKAKEWRQNALRGNAASKQQQQRGQQGGKRKAGEEAAGGAGEAEAQPKGRQGEGAGQQQHAKKAKREGGAAAAAGEPAGGAGEEGADFKFARIELDEDGKRKAKAARPPKTVLLKKAEAQKAELEAAAGTAEGKAKAQQAAWKAALARAAGEKVLDDPKLLRRSLKREGKKREKHAKEWKERVGLQQEAQAARQTKRTDNLAARRQTKLDNKKAKREKKLLRPGFEGRKEGFITGGAAAKTAAGAK